jgi:hypothetical protein
MKGTELEQRYDATLSQISALDGRGRLSPRSGRFTSGIDLAHIA